MENKFNKGISEVQGIKMTAEEKAELFKRISIDIESSKLNAHTNVLSPWNIHMFGIWLHTSRVAFAGALSLVIALTSGTLAYAAEGSLPGDILYPVKVKITEPVRDILAVNEELKAKWQAQKAERRMEESETLSVEGRLDTAKEDEVKKLITKHTEKLNESLDVLRKQNSETLADNIGDEFQVEMNAHAELLDTLEVKAPRVAKMMSIEPARFSEPVKGVAETARENAKNIADKIGKKKFSNKERKETLESVIETTSFNVDSLATDTTPFRKKIISNTQNKIKDAKQLFKDGVKQNNSGDYEKSDDSFLNSGRKVKEARVFMEKGFEVEKRIKSDDYRNNNEREN